MLIFRTDQFPLPLPAGHRFPAEKYRLLAEAASALTGAHLETAPAATPDELKLAHAANYVDSMLDGSVPASIMREIGLPWSQQLVERSARSVGATIAAARAALLYGAGVNLAGGTHHAGHAKGGGFCVFNDVAVAIRLQQREGLIRRAAVIDLDVHQGNGTAELFQGDSAVFTLSLHGEKNFPFRRVPSTLDVGVADNTGDGAYLQLLDDALHTLAGTTQPDIVFYLAGADPYEGDRLGRLALSKAGLLARDRRVFDLCESRQWPLAVAMAGGYAVPIADTVDIHLQTVRELLSRHQMKGG